MKALRRRPTGVVPAIMLLVLLTLAIPGAPAQPAASHTSLADLRDRQPGPELSPSEVVRIQAHAFMHNNAENEGIEIAYRFSSPNNRRATGPLPRFIQMMNTAFFRPLLDADTVEVGEPRSVGSLALVRVDLRTGGGTRASYDFFLIRQSDYGCYRCWLTDSVTVNEVERSPNA
jgi:hypothetical protein